LKTYPWKERGFLPQGWKFRIIPVPLAMINQSYIKVAVKDGQPPSSLDESLDG
jgi:hypothetical protein